MNNQSFVIDQLNSLIEINRDRVKGYEKAVEEVGQDARLSNVFRQHAIESRSMVSDLTRTVSQMGGKPESSGTTMGTLHRAWMDVKNTFTTEEKESALENCEFGDKAAVNVYNQVLDDDKDQQIPSYVREMLNKQCRTIQQNLSRIERLEEAYDAVDA